MVVMDDKQVSTGGHNLQCKVTSSPPSSSGASAGASPESTPTESTSTPKRTAEEVSDEPKRRRILRACDICRRRKIRCDGPGPSVRGGNCTHCRDNSLLCTYVNESSRRAPRPGLVSALSERALRLEHLVQQLLPGCNTEDIVGPAICTDSFDEDVYSEVLRSHSIPSLPDFKKLRTPSHTGRPTAPLPRRASQERPACWSSNTDPCLSGREFDEPDSSQFYGPAAARNLVFELNNRGDVGFATELQHVRRLHIWKVPEWEAATTNDLSGAVDPTVWPEDQHATLLFDAYFANVNNIFPLLNSNTLRGQYFQRLYMRNTAFARLCLLVFANGSRFAASAPFTQWHGSSQPLSAGWKYFNSFRRSTTGLHEKTSLFSLQTAALLGFFLCGNADPSVIWSTVGCALRSAQDLGIHIRLPPASSLAELQERELLSRAFWCLYHLDRSVCAFLGRDVALPDAGIGAAWPRAVDDAFWNAEGMEQPAGVPSQLDAFIHILRLDRIVSAALESISSGMAGNNNPTAGVVSCKVEEPPVPSKMTELVTLLDAWMRNLPAHLQWSDQALLLPDHAYMRLAHLHAHHHWAVMYVHHCRVVAGKWTAKMSFDVSMQSANAMFSIFEGLLQHNMHSGGGSAIPIPLGFMDYAWLAAATTLVAVNTSSLLATEIGPAMAGVNTCIAVLVQMECVSRKSGQMADLLTVMVRNVDLQMKGCPPNSTPFSASSPFSEPTTSPVISDTPFSQQSVQSIPSAPPTSLPTPTSISPFLSPHQASPDDLPWLFSSQQQAYADVYPPQPSPIYFADATSPAINGAGTMPGVGGSVLSFAVLENIPTPGWKYTSDPKVSPMEPIAMPVHCDPRPVYEPWSHAMTTFVTGLNQPNGLVPTHNQQLQLQSPTSGGLPHHH